ncbi:MAG TPA: hypothetical protein VD926_04735 [Acidimicrobiales bacterium]|nr:hypothetical protein [Acidimicrobiales bacterium]
MIAHVAGAPVEEVLMLAFGGLGTGLLLAGARYGSFVRRRRPAGR